MRLLSLLMICIAPFAAAETVFFGVGEDGEASFSDTALLGHRAVEVEVIPADQTNASQLRRATQEMDALAGELKAQRHARAQQRQHQQREHQQRQPQQTPAYEYTPPLAYDRYQYPYQPYPVVRHFPKRRPPPAISPAPEPPPRSTYAPAFRPVQPAFQPPLAQ